ncbi:LysR family transcriptional regulator [Ensifer soli]|uniref:LysR family transcriptional regulator n=1 Tax=Ciceribacter sp. sgz301302 TaxID=3342379 RepID=UPI0035B89FFE
MPRCLRRTAVVQERCRRAEGGDVSGLSDLRMFAEIARSRNLSQAAARLGMSPATISGRLKALEEHFGLSLVQRTTRAVALTEEGRLLLERSSDLLKAFTELEQAMGARKRGLAGAIVVSGPGPFCRRHVLPAARSFAADNPGIRFEFRFDPDDVPERVRPDIQIRPGDERHAALITRRLAEQPMMLVAAPAYAARHGLPVRPAEITRHRGLIEVVAGVPQDMVEVAGGEDAGVFRLQGHFLAADLQMLVDLALAGEGLLFGPAEDLCAHVERGRLIAVLPGRTLGERRLQLVSARRDQLPSRTCRFIDHLLEWLRSTTPPHPGIGRGQMLPATKVDDVKFFSLQN